MLQMLVVDVRSKLDYQRDSINLAKARIERERARIEERLRQEEERAKREESEREARIKAEKSKRFGYRFKMFWKNLFKRRKPQEG